MPCSQFLTIIRLEEGYLKKKKRRGIYHHRHPCSLPLDRTWPCRSSVPPLPLSRAPLAHTADVWAGHICVEGRGVILCRTRSRLPDPYPWMPRAQSSTPRSSREPKESPGLTCSTLGAESPHAGNYDSKPTLDTNIGLSAGGLGEKQKLMTIRIHAQMKMFLVQVLSTFNSWGMCGPEKIKCPVPHLKLLCAGVEF